LKPKIRTGREANSTSTLGYAAKRGVFLEEDGRERKPWEVILLKSKDWAKKTRGHLETGGKNFWQQKNCEKGVEKGAVEKSGRMGGKGRGADNGLGRKGGGTGGGGGKTQLKIWSRQKLWGNRGTTYLQKGKGTGNGGGVR